MSYKLTAHYNNPYNLVTEKIVDSGDKAACLISLCLLVNEGVYIRVERIKTDD